MNRAMILAHLAQAERHVAQSQEHIAKQTAIVARLEVDGHDTAEARILLRLFVDLQVEHQAHRDRLLKALGERP
jgi:hypothetical protein